VSPTYIESAFLRPVHADRAGIIYTRAYDSLVGITTEMDRQISSVLAEGIANGNNPRKIAAAIVDRVDKIGITRARMIARTEVIAAHAEAKLNTYEDANIQGVGLMSEWLTANDGKVCEECEAASNKGPYTVEAAHGMIPLHPNCRCTWVPFIISGKEIELQ
jgi:SPP1 gp7 family putative phage head morphogenesis protein